jgi:hypothetical protein
MSRWIACVLTAIAVSAGVVGCGSGGGGSTTITPEVAKQKSMQMGKPEGAPNFGAPAQGAQGAPEGYPTGGDSRSRGPQ